MPLFAYCLYKKIKVLIIFIKSIDMKKIVLIATIISTTFMACKKSKVEETASAPTMIGLWKGSIAIASSPLVLYLKADNTLNVYNTLDTATTLANGKGTGTWTKTSNIVNVTYKFNQQTNSTTAALTVNDALNNMSGDAFALGSLLGRVQLNK
jgi:hypothetical protein